MVSDDRLSLRLNSNRIRHISVTLDIELCAAWCLQSALDLWINCIPGFTFTINRGEHDEDFDGGEEFNEINIEINFANENGFEDIEDIRQ